MRLGGPLYNWNRDPDRWIAAARKENYSAALIPIGYEPESELPSEDEVRAFSNAAKKANLLIAEAGAWSNPIDPNPENVKKAIETCIGCLSLADLMGARCTVNIAGSRNPKKWDGPHPDNFSRETFDQIVETTRKIVDSVKPVRTFYCLESMPWIFPSSPDQYLNLIRAIDRPMVAVHLDPVNMINCPERVYNTTGFIKDCFNKLGPYIKSCHAKDIIFRENLTVHLDECRPGTGMLDYVTFLKEVDKLDPDTPIILEHLPREEYPAAATHLRQVAANNNLQFIEITK